MIRNATIRKMIGVGELEEKLRECRLRWLGHVIRREEGYVGTRVRRMVVERRKREDREGDGRTVSGRIWRQRE